MTRRFFGPCTNYEDEVNSVASDVRSPSQWHVSAHGLRSYPRCERENGDGECRASIIKPMT